PNEKGTSTIIAARHIISTGQSPWTSDNSAIVRRVPINKSARGGPAFPPKDGLPWACGRDGRIEAEVEIDGKIKNLAVILKTNNGSAIKQFKINDKPTTKPKFIQLLSTVIFSPDLIDVLMFEPRQRRLFLDSYVSKVDIEYQDIAQQYEKSLRQRNSLLKMLSKKNTISDSDKNSLRFWTESLINFGTSITLKRIDFVERINQVNKKLYPNSMRYRPSLDINMLETLADSDYVKKVYKKMLNEKFRKELILGITLVGPHRDDWILTYNGKNLNKYGSRGEKRMAIADIAFKMNQLLIEDYKEKPVILLDDISSELDKKNIERLLKEKILPEQQTIMTTTDLKKLLKYIGEKHQVIEL
ncbi:MAG: DNA replication and repair protein RecF, partial [bacterium]